MEKTRLGRRNFLIAAGASGAVAVAAIGANTAARPAAGAKRKDGAKRAGYELTEHVRNYYRTTLV